LTIFIAFDREQAEAIAHPMTEAPQLRGERPQVIERLHLCLTSFLLICVDSSLGAQTITNHCWILMAPIVTLNAVKDFHRPVVSDS
jgi:hypothetical protein